MIVRLSLLATILFAASAQPCLAQTREEVIRPPVLRADVTVSGELVRIGDVIENAGSAAQIAIYRAPDLGTTGALPTAQVLEALRAHQVIGVETRDIQQVSVTRLSRTLEAKEIELQVARALERKNGLGDADNLTLIFDNSVQDVRLDTTMSGAMRPVALRFDSRNGRFDLTFEIGGANAGAPARLRFTGTAIETVEAVVLARGVERNEVLKASDVVVERRPKAEVGSDLALRERVVGMQARRALRAGQAVKVADIAKPDLVQRDQGVTIIYEAAGLYLTLRGKALEAGTEGDVVSVLNLQSKRTITGVVVGRGQISVSTTVPRPAAPEMTSSLRPNETATPVALAATAAPTAE
jgi:flagellar basal body P-ring formation protein FlgA